MSEELKPCPFCGCQATMLTDAENVRITGSHGAACPCRDVDVIVDNRDAWDTRAELAALKAGQGEMSQAATDVLAERKRQIIEEGWTPENDDHYTYGEIADAAACYALWGGGSSPHNFDQFWPWDRSWLKFGQARQMLVKSGALILAEIERLDRAAAAPPAQQKEYGDE